MSLQSFIHKPWRRLGVKSILKSIYPISNCVPLLQTNSGLREGSGGLIVPTNASILDAFSQVTDWLTKAENAASDVSSCVDRFPLSGPGIKCTDGDILVLKATSQATLGCLEECLYALQLQQRQTCTSNKKSSTFGSTSSVK